MDATLFHLQCAETLILFFLLPMKTFKKVECYSKIAKNFSTAKNGPVCLDGRKLAQLFNVSYAWCKSLDSTILSKQKNTESGFISRQGKTVEEKEKGVELCTKEGSCIKKICSKVRRQRDQVQSNEMAYQFMTFYKTG